VRKFCLLMAVLVLAGAAGQPRAAEPVTVFAASSLVDVLTAIEQAFEEKTGFDIRVAYAASSVLARQIESGAPADLYLSANTDWVDYLVAKGFATEANTAILAKNTLVLITPKSQALRDFAGLAEFDFAAWFDSDERLAIADPDHVPAGLYAKQSLETLGRWDAVKDRLAIANNVRAALLLVARGEVPVGIVYRTDAKASSDVRLLAALPPETHDPILYRLARIGGKTSESAQAFWDFLRGSQAATILLKYGFIPTRR